jgi:hypothetical protein
MNFQELFNHMNEEHGLILTETEMFEIIHIVLKIKAINDLEKS